MESRLFCSSGTGSPTFFAKRCDMMLLCLSVNNKSARNSAVAGKTNPEYIQNIGFRLGTNSWYKFYGLRCLLLVACAHHINSLACCSQHLLHTSFKRFSNPDKLSKMEEIPKMTPNKEARRSHHIARRSRNRDFHMQPPSLKLSRHVRLFGRDSPEGQMASAKHHLATSLSSFVLPRKRMRIDFPADIGDSSRDWSPQITARASATSAAKPQSPIFLLNTDVLAEVMLFLEPTETLQVMTMPLSKSWLKLYGSQPDVWEILCHSAPFKAPKIESQEIPIALSSTKSTRPYLSGRYRLLYGSFVKCIKYLRQLKCDALNGRTHRSSMGNTCQFVPYSSLEECPPPSCSKPRETCVKQHGQKPPFPGSAKVRRIEPYS